MTLVVIGDTAGKLLTENGTSPVFVAWSRFAIAALVLLPFSGLRRVELASLRDWRVAARGLFIAIGVCCILTALRTEPIADVFGAFFIGPLISYLLAMPFLGERPTPLQGALLVAGFCGVMLVVKPGFGATPGMGFALAAGISYGAYLAATRAVAASFRPRFLLISQLLVASAILTPFGLAAEMPDPEPATLGLIAISAMGSAAGNYLLVLANRRAEASLIAPLVYTQIISATLIGAAVFGDWPDWIAGAGLALILASGVGSLLASKRGARKKAAPAERP